MAKIESFVAPTGNFLKAEHLKENPTIAVVTGEAEIVHNEKYDVDRLHIPVEIEAKAFTFDCSKTNARTIAATLGDDTKNWIGKELMLEQYKTKTSDGAMVDAINVKGIKG